MVLMSVKPGEEIDLEMHERHDQFIRIEQGNGRVLMGKCREDYLLSQGFPGAQYTAFMRKPGRHMMQNIQENTLKQEVDNLA